MKHQHSIFARRPVLTGIAVGVATLVPHAFLAPQASVGYAAIVIALIAGIYFGFAVMNGSPRDQMVEFNVTGLFSLAGVLGLLFWPCCCRSRISRTPLGTLRITIARDSRSSPYRPGMCPGASSST